MILGDLCVGLETADAQSSHRARFSLDPDDAGEKRQRNAFPKQSLPRLVDFSQPQHQQAWLSAALAELRECSDEAREEGHPEPTEKALVIAEAVLKRIARLTLDLPEPSVYPSADCEIVVFFCWSSARAAVSLSIDADGGGACFSNLGGLRRSRYGDIGEVPDVFVKSELHKLSRLAPAD